MNTEDTQLVNDALFKLMKNADTSLKAHEAHILDESYKECQSLGYNKKQKKIFIQTIKENLKQTSTKRRLQKKLFDRQREGW